MILKGIKSFPISYYRIYIYICSTNKLIDSYNRKGIEPPALRLPHKYDDIASRERESTTLQ